MANRIQHRRDTAANWTSINPVLAAGEIGMETDTGNTKLGDGVTAWASLGYQAPNAAALAATYAPVPGASRNVLTSWWHADGYGAKNDDATDARAAINQAMVDASAAGGGIVYLPRGKYVVSGALTPRSGVTLYGPGASIRTSANGSVIYGSTTAFSDFTIDGITFTGPVTETPSSPQRARTTSGNGTTTAIQFSGDLDTSNTSGTAQAITNFTMRNCAVRNCSGLPILIAGVRGMVRVTNCEFTNNMDVGFIFNQEVIFNNNHVQMSADNGVSLSRGNVKVTCVGNTFENCCYNGIFAAGWSTDLGPQNVTITGNVVRNVGNSGIYLDSAPKYGSVSGNELDGGYFRGPSDTPTDGAVCGIFIGGYPASNRASPTAWAEGWVISNNQIRRFPRAGIYMTSVKRVLVLGNQISDIGTQYLADGTTAISAADQTQNVGILLDNATTTTNLLIALNHIVDSRATPYCNWGIYPVGSSTADESFNTMYGCRNAYNLVETGQTRNINWGAVFQQNSKHTAGATAGSNAGSGSIAGFDINGAAGSTRRHKITTAGVGRWEYGGSGDAESGGNAGTDWVLNAYDDTGAFLGTILRVTRKGAHTIGIQGQPVTIPGRIVSGAASVTGITAGAQAASAAAGGNGANDTAGTLNATAVASPSAGTLVTVTFATAYATTPHVVLTPQNAASASCQPYLTRSSTGFSIACATAPGASASLSFDYHVLG